MLKALDDSQVKEPQEPLRTCESCGIQKKSSESINCIMVVGSPGHASLMPFQCPHVEHWSCSRECWSKVAHACIDEHMLIVLQQKHQELEKHDTI